MALSNFPDDGEASNLYRHIYNVARRTFCNLIHITRNFSSLIDRKVIINSRSCVKLNFISRNILIVGYKNRFITNIQRSIKSRIKLLYIELYPC